VALIVFYALVVVLGMLSMGFQMLASHLLSPHYGSTIVEWVWLISTFLAAFSTGSVLGGWISNLPTAQRGRLQIAVAAVGVAALAVTAFWSHGMLDWIELKFIPDVSQMNDQSSTGMNTAVFLSCMGLFFVPVTALSSFGPQCVGWLAARGTPPGKASGIVYGVSTLGNIAGVMLTVFVLLQRFPVSRLLYGWLTVAALSLTSLILLMRRTAKTSAP
jgi:hypothetical protein